MPVHVEQLNSEVTLIDGDLPLTDEQLEKLVQRVLQDSKYSNNNSSACVRAVISTRFAPPLRIEE